MREEPPRLQRRVNDQAISLAREWRVLGRVATVVSLMTAPALFALLYWGYDWQLLWALVGTIVGVVVFRGGVGVLAHRMIPSPAIYGAESELKAEDVISRRRVWYWRHKFRVWTWLAIIIVVVLGTIAIFNNESLLDAGATITDNIPGLATQAITLFFTFFVLFIINFGILFGPLVFMGAQQIKTYEPGDADWGVKLDDVRGQFEAKQEITRVVSLWQSGEEFEKAGGKRERGVLFLGAPGTGKTMLSKAIATSFNCPFITMPGSGFQQTFIGMDAVIVRWLAWKARRLAQKWGGQCIVFIDEIDAVGMRRRALGTGGQYNPAPGWQPYAEWQQQFYGPFGAVNPSGDLICENKAWRDWMFEQRAPERRSPY